jgi:hypothetical protein
VLNVNARFLAILALPVVLAACVETTTATTTNAAVNQLSDGGVEVTLSTGCVTRWNIEGAMTYASEGPGGCSDSDISTARGVAIANIQNL